MKRDGSEDRPEDRPGDYLWDGSGPASADVRRLEQLLGRHRWVPRAFVPRSQSRSLSRRHLLVGLAAAAAAVLLLWRSLVPAPGYRVEGLPGVAVARPGDTLRVDERPARLAIADLGEVELGPGSLVEVRRIRRGEHRLFMHHGTLRARIVAAPRVFQVDSRAGLTIDLGCEYVLEVAGDGRLRLVVTRGQVAFAFDDGEREVYVPAGAWCESIPGLGPTPPMFEDASAELEALVARFVAGEPGPADLARLAGPWERDDLLPFFALLMDPAQPREVRAAIYDVFERVFQRPAGVERAGILAGDAELRDAWLEVIGDHWRRQ